MIAIGKRLSLLKYLLFVGLLFNHHLLAAQPDQVLNLMNEVRTDPQGFLNNRLLPFLKEKQLEDNSYAKSLMDELKSARKINPLSSSAVLEKLARAHAQDMGSKGKVGHTSSNGTTFENRVRKKIKTGMIAENCDYGNTEPLEIVTSLLIDDGVTSLGHRKNILQPGLKYVGIAIEQHKTYGMNCVMDFSDAE
jgi:uncharacterized protein YkwD